jgi:hypothetical protein
MTWVKCGFFILLLLLLVGCTLEAKLKQDMEPMRIKTKTQSIEPIDEPIDEPIIEPAEEPTNQPTNQPIMSIYGDVANPADVRLLTLVATAEYEEEKVIVHIDTDLTFSSENYGRKDVFGEGHIHFYVNNEYVDSIMNNGPFEVTEFLDKDKDNRLKFVLAGNSHSEVYFASRELVITAGKTTEIDNG